MSYVEAFGIVMNAAQEYRSEWPEEATGRLRMAISIVHKHGGAATELLQLRAYIDNLGMTTIKLALVREEIDARLAALRGQRPTNLNASDAEWIAESHDLDYGGPHGD